MPPADPLALFSPAVRSWFATAFPQPTAPQVLGWPAIATGAHTLVCAPTGTGKTLTAFLWGLDRLLTTAVPERERRTRVVYVSPLRALAFDVDKNLRAPLAGIRLAAERIGVPVADVVVGMRTGDTTARERAGLVRRPPDLLITTPESLYLMLTSSARETLAGVEAVIVDEIHALAPTKRGAHLALSLERLEARCERPPQRIGLSATQRPLSEIARFLGGYDAPDRLRPVTIVDAGIRKELALEVVVPVEDMADLGRPVTDLGPAELRSGPATAALAGPVRKSIWPSVYPEVLRRILAHRSTIVFCNARRAAERLAAKLNELAELEGLGGPDGTELVKAHHGSLAREQRVVIEDQLKRGVLRAIVATSSLELGIDMGAVDHVVQVESPGSVSRGLQRVGRAGHSVGEPSSGTIFPKHRSDLLEAAVVAGRMRAGLVEETRYLRNPLDVLAQQVVAAVAMEDWPIDRLAALVRRAAGFAELTDDVWHATVDLLAGRYPSEEFAELRPRLVWDRTAGTLRARDGSRRLAVTSGGTIPDRGLFGVFLPDGTRVGELDEEMVYESRPGEVFVLGASAWRIQDITFERVTVVPAPGEPGKMPFWHGDRPGRPLELGRALGAFVRQLRGQPAEAAVERLRVEDGLDAWAAQNLVQYLADQANATGAVPDDRTVVVERFRDEIGDWRVCILSPFGSPVHAPWAMAIERRLADRHGMPVEVMWSDDGIAVRLPEAITELDPDDVALAPDEIERALVEALPSTSLFAARFRECAARALLLPRRRPDRRTPLWQQRQRAADLLAVAARHPTFPILLETSRECLQDVFDLPALREVLRDLQARRIRLVSVETDRASPFAQGLLFNWVANYLYDGDAPLAERRAAALSLDRDLLRELLGAEELRELIDPGALADVELELADLTEHRRARSADELHDLLRRLGDLTVDELDVRAEPGDGSVASWVAELERSRRALPVRVAGEVRWIAGEDASRYRDALGCALPLGLPAAFTEPVEHPLESLVGRYARTHGPFLPDEVARRFGIPVERVAGALRALEGAGRVVRGEFRPDGLEREWCDVEVLRLLRRRSLAALRREVEPVEQAALARFLTRWHGIGEGRRGPDVLVEAIGQLQGATVVASLLDTELLPARLERYRPSDLDALCAAGEVVWVGAGALGSSDGRVRLVFREQAAALLDGPDPARRPGDARHEALRERLGARGACFWPDLRAADPSATDTELLAALWDLVWAGEVTNDALAPLRAYVSGRGTAAARARARPGRLRAAGPPAGAGRWSLVAPLLEGAPNPTERAPRRALQLLERHGVLTREAVTAEEVPGGFSAVYAVLKVLEERGRVRRGYLVDGLGAAQFALPGAADRLRERRDDEASTVVLASSDPAQPYGAALEWPDPAGPARPSRVTGSIVVLSGGRPQAWLDRRSHQLVTFAAVTDDVWIDALAERVRTGRDRSLEIRRIDGGSIGDSVWSGALEASGFVHGYKGLVLRSDRLSTRR
ncbi:MAG: DEAD/DEAH box helicase [Acidimicrobiales bacterium]